MSSIIELFFWLLVGHAVADFALQSPYMAAAKSKVSPEGVGIWSWVLFMHGLIHGGMVAYATGYVWLGILEVIAHMLIDHAKVTGRFGSGRRSFMADQYLHIMCKLVWAFVVLAL